MLDGRHSIEKDPREGGERMGERDSGIARSEERDDIVSAIVVLVAVCVMVSLHGSFSSTISNTYRPLRLETTLLLSTLCSIAIVGRVSSGYMPRTNTLASQNSFPVPFCLMLTFPDFSILSLSPLLCCGPCQRLTMMILWMYYAMFLITNDRVVC